MTDDLHQEALEHYNNDLRRRYGLREVAAHELDRIVWPKGDEEGDVSAFPDGLAAAIAREVVRGTPQFAAGMIDANGRTHVTTGARGSWPTGHGRDKYGLFLASYPFGGVDNFESALKAFTTAARADREASLVGLALSEIPDEDWADQVLDDHGGATYAGRIVERARQGHLEQVAWVFDVGVSTLKDWRRRHRDELTGPRGRPRKDSQRP
jgi:hypothetical protein